MTEMRWAIVISRPFAIGRGYTRMYGIISSNKLKKWAGRWPSRTSVWGLPTIACDAGLRIVVTVTGYRQDWVLDIIAASNFKLSRDVWRVLSAINGQLLTGHPVELTRPTYGIAGNSYQKRTLRAHDNRRGD